MTALAVPGLERLAGLARRTAVVRAVLAVALVGLVLAAAAAARHPEVRRPAALPVRSGDLVVLDLSASISSDTFGRIGETLRKLVATNGRYGLVVFSNVAYEALPLGTPASALKPLIRFFTLPATAPAGGAIALPTNPWTLSFSSGTRISAGLDFAHRLLVQNGLARRSHVLLISDLADDPEDLQRLDEVATAEYGKGRTALRVVALDATPDDKAFFEHLANAAVADASAPAAKPPPVATTPPAALSLWLIAAIAAIAVALGLQALWSARLRWSTRPARGA